MASYRLGIALFVLLVILGLIKWGSGFVANVAVLLGIVAGTILAAVSASCISRRSPRRHGRDRAAAAFRDTEISARAHHHHVHRDDRGHDRIPRQCSWAGRDHRQGDQPRRADPCLRADGSARSWAAVQHFSLYIVLAECRSGRITGVRSRWVTIAGGGILLLLGLVPKMAALSKPCRWWCSAARS